MARSGRFQVVVPTRDSARWIAPFYRAYERLGISPLYLVDSRSSDGTAGILGALGARIETVTPRHDRVEAMLQFTRDLPGDDWFIRFDDDELPSAELIRWLHQNLAQVEAPTLAISRRDVQLNAGALHYSRMELYYFHPDDPTFLDPQWRGFVASEVNFIDAIHTPGFELTRFLTVPDAAYFVHWDWILRSQAERMEKLRRYERQSPGSGWKFSQFYLPELVREASRWTPLLTDQFSPLLSEILAARSASAGISPAPPCPLR